VTRARAIATGALLALVAAFVATAAPARERPAELGRMAAEGAVTLAAAGSSHAIITASNLRPGQSVAGTIALANVGDSRGRLTLLRTRTTDTPGRFGGRLSEALLLRVEEIGGGSWTGPLAGPEALDLGIMEPGEGRSYRLTLTLPDTGPAGRDNAVQGSSVTIDWAWATESVGPPAATPTASPTPAPAPPGPPPATAVPQTPQPAPGAPRLNLWIPHQRVLGTRGIDVYGGCDRPCRVAFKARIQTSPLARASARTLLRRRVFRALGAPRRLPIKGADRRIRLKLTPRAVRTLKRTLHLRGRVAVVVEARVRGAGGSRTVTRRIVLKRAERTVTGGRAAPGRG
jgi:spore coat-associated protein N